MRAPASSAGSPTRALAVLTLLNLLNYVDRYVPAAVKDLFKRDLGLTDTETSLPFTAFAVVYMVASPAFGALADRMERKRIIAGGVVLWSLATAAAAWTHRFTTFLLARAAVGVGEAAYATLAPTLINDLYPQARRNRALTWFYTAIPVGAAIGFAAGGALGERLGWRAAFLICGLPGLATAGLILLLRDPGRTEEAGALMDWPTALRELGKNREYLVTVAGYTAVTFASGALADWFPAFLSRYRGLSIAEAGSLVGTSAVVGGLGGTIVGGLLGDALRGRTRKPYLAASALPMILAALLAALTLFARSKLALWAGLLGAQFFLWFYNAPINHVILAVVSDSLRARAFSLSILSIHILGDAISPAIVGVIADRTGSLRLGITLCPLALAVGALLWLYGWRTLPER